METYEATAEARRILGHGAYAFDRRVKSARPWTEYQIGIFRGIGDHEILAASSKSYEQAFEHLKDRLSAEKKPSE